MKLRKLFAGVAAVAVASSAVAITASAKITNPNTDLDKGEDKAFYTISPMDEGIAIADIYGIAVDLTLAEGWEAEGSGGGLAWQSSSVSWTSVEWGNPDSGKECEFDANGDFSYLSDAPLYGADDEWTQACIQWWWGADVTVESVKFLDASGAVIGEEAAVTTTTTAADEEEVTTTTTAAEAGDDTAATTTTAAEAGDDTAATTTTAAAGSAATGVEGVASVVALLTIAGAAIVVSKKN
ncbi:MAG: hypothetical protein IJO29_04865 [Oscillospiraceae bacterium]|nr:hypothetical protein [Oscillospiraceae bacterium]